MNRPKNIRRGSSGVHLTAIYLVAMVLLYLGERLVMDSNMLRLVLAGASLSGIFYAIFARLGRARGLGKERAGAKAEGLLLRCYVFGLFALLLYAMQSDVAMESLGALFSKAETAERYKTILATLWPIVWLCSTLPLLFIEISYGPMDIEHTVDLARIGRSMRSGLTVGMTICSVFVINYILSEFNQKIDLSYFKTTHPSESTKKMIANLSAPMKAVLFFPEANDVREQVANYFDELARSSKNFVVEKADHAMSPEKAKEYKVSGNGMVALVKGKKSEKITLDVKLDRAKTKLKKLDQEFQTAFMKLNDSRKTAYFTVGHDEFGRTARSGDRGSSLRDLRSQLTRFNYTTKDLGLTQGLASKIPDDAGVVIIAGPQKPFLPEEIATLQKYLATGGRLMLFANPESAVDFSALLTPYGLKMTNEILGNDKYNYPVSRTPADHHVLTTNRFSSHPAVSTLSRNSSKLASIFLGAGHLSTMTEKGKKGAAKVQFLVHGMSFTYNDTNRNFKIDPPKETRKTYELAAALSVPVKTDASNTAGKETRLIVVADADLITDKVFRNAGNAYLFIDGLKWLVGEERYIGATSSEEDIRIRHTRKEDQLWFYLSIFAMPALVLVAGLFYVRRRRKKS